MRKNLNTLLSASHTRTAGYMLVFLGSLWLWLQCLSMLAWAALEPPRAAFSASGYGLYVAMFVIATASGALGFLILYLIGRVRAAPMLPDANTHQQSE